MAGSDAPLRLAARAQTRARARKHESTASGHLKPPQHKKRKTEKQLVLSFLLSLGQTPYPTTLAASRWCTMALIVVWLIEAPTSRTRPQWTRHSRCSSSPSRCSSCLSWHLVSQHLLLPPPVLLLLLAGHSSSRRQCRCHSPRNSNNNISSRQQWRQRCCLRCRQETRWWRRSTSLPGSRQSHNPSVR